jgi:hypothetical protein
MDPDAFAQRLRPGFGRREALFVVAGGAALLLVLILWLALK